MGIASVDRERRRLALVTTTIRVPLALEEYVRQFDDLGHGNVLVVVIGDRATPPQTKRWLDTLSGQAATVVYLGPEEQTDWLRRIPALGKLLPWNSIQRRNLGYLFAAEQGADVIISTDDDNYVTEQDFLGCHAIVGTTRYLDVVRSSTGWFNVGVLLETEPVTSVMVRGFPQSYRQSDPILAFEAQPVHIVLNAGLWLGDPDVDAATRLVTPAQVVGLQDDYRLPLALARGTYCPVNSQNTAFDVRLLPCVYLVVMGARYRGMAIGRYDDVWMSYFAKCVIDHLGDSVTIGPPLVRQERNPHNVLEDLVAELPGMMLTEVLMPALKGIDLQETTYLGCYFELIERLRVELSRPDVCGPEERQFFDGVLNGMQVWADACQQIIS